MPRTVNVNYVTKEVKILLHDSETESLAAATAIAAAAEAQEAKDVVVDNLQDSLDAIDAKTEEEKSELDGYTEEKKAEVSTVGQGYVDSASQKVDEANTILTAIRNEYGYPFTAATAADMTDTSKIYVYVGNETGYTNGNWYYNNGTAWVSGGVYNSTAFDTDTTLTISGAAADAKVTGDKFKATVVGSLPYITSSNKASICNGTLDDLPVNTIFTINGSANLTNEPTGLAGSRYTGTKTAVTFSCSNVRAAHTTGMFQIVQIASGPTFVRIYNNNAWTTWKRFGQNDSLIGSGLIITADNKDVQCGGDLNNIKPNTIYYIASDAGLDNAPNLTANITLISLSNNAQRTLDSGNIQLAFDYTGKLAYRMYAGGGWFDWNYLSSKESLQQRGQLNASSYNNLLSNVNDIGIYFFDQESFTDSPVNGMGNATLIVYPQNTSFRLQVVYGSSASTGKYVYYRLIYVDGRVYKNWWCVGGTQARRILGIGDSICMGYRNSNRGYIGLLGIPYVNAGVGGALLAQMDGYGWIEQQLIDRTEEEGFFDAIIMEGGINDFVRGAPLGTLSSVPVRTTDTELYNALDVTTTIGALEHLFVTLQSKYPNIDKFFVITHKTNNYPYVNNRLGHSQEDMHNALVACCKLYNVQVIDIYAESPINTYFPEYVSPTSYEDDHSVTDMYWVDNDKIHPLNYGYLHGYVPLILKALEGASHK